MVNPVGFRFRPTDEEIIDHYLRFKNLDTNTSHVDQVINTLNICNFDPWDLPCQSMINSTDQVWYFFGRKESKYKRGDKQSRKTKSGFWKKTGPTMDILRKKGNREKIGEKRVLVFHSNRSKTNWVMHEYLATLLSHTQSMTYTLCKVEFKGEASEMSPFSSCEIEQSHSLIPHENIIGGFSTRSEVLQSQTLPKGSSFEWLETQELQSPCQFSGFLDMQEVTPLEDVMHMAFDNLSSYDWQSFLVHDDDDDDQQSK